MLSIKPILALLTLAACTSTGPKPEGASAKTNALPLENIRLPEGYAISLYAENLPDARSLCLSPNGTLFVGTRNNGAVYALRDTNQDGAADLRFTLAQKLNMPNGVAFRDGNLYVAEVHRILRWDNIEDRLDNPGEPTVVCDKYPTDSHHGWKYIAFGPDGMLYIPVGAPCNICEPENPVYCTITRIDVTQNNPDPEIVQRGIRNTVGFTWSPGKNELWFTDNGRDWLGDDLPACELNHAPKKDMHFGYPYCHQGDLPDPKFGSDKHPCSNFTPPAQQLGPHVAPLGLEFCKGEQFGKKYPDGILIAEHGSWNRTRKIGYRISLVRIDEKAKAIAYEDFATGWLKENEEVWGRPVDLEYLPDGSLLVSDDYAGAIYRIYRK